MSATACFVLPTSTALTSNDRRHFHDGARHVREIRETVRYTGLDRTPIRVPVDVECAITWADRHHRDAANWYPTLKAAVDEIVALGILADDSNRHVRKVTIWATEPDAALKGKVRFKVTLTPIGNAGNGADAARMVGISEGPRIAPETPLTTSNARSPR